MRRALLGLLLTAFSGCVFLPQRGGYPGPKARPTEVLEYYRINGSYTGAKEEPIEVRRGVTHSLITVGTTLGDISVDYYAAEKPTDDLVLVFPILGGKYLFEKHFAQHFAERGFDAAIVHRNGDFKNPDKFYEIEQIFRDGVVRDRMMLDYFEKEKGKRDFASFGLSRGAINAAVTAGVDERLKYNMLVLGGSEILNIFRSSDQRGLLKYRNKVLAAKNINEQQFFDYIESNLKTDPKLVAPYVDARNTLMILATLDSTVPFKYGMRLRRQMGYPDTIFLFADHYTSLLYTEFVNIGFPAIGESIVPPGYVEAEAVGFFRKRFGHRGFSVKELAFDLFKVPFGVFGALQCLSEAECRKDSADGSERKRYRELSLPGSIRLPRYSAVQRDPIAADSSAAAR